MFKFLILHSFFSKPTVEQPFIITLHNTYIYGSYKLGIPTVAPMNIYHYTSSLCPNQMTTKLLIILAFSFSTQLEK